MTIIVQIKEINGNATLQKELGKVGSRGIICPLLPRFQIEGRSGKRTGIYNGLRLGIVYQTEQKAFLLSSIRTSNVYLSPAPVASVPWPALHIYNKPYFRKLHA